jgi:hypothetical protein
MFAISTAAVLKKLIQGRHLYWALPFRKGSLDRAFVPGKSFQQNLIYNRPFHYWNLLRLKMLVRDKRSWDRIHNPSFLLNFRMAPINKSNYTRLGRLGSDIHYLIGPISKLRSKWRVVKIAPASLSRAELTKNKCVTVLTPGFSKTSTNSTIRSQNVIKLFFHHRWRKVSCSLLTLQLLQS